MNKKVYTKTVNNNLNCETRKQIVMKLSAAIDYLFNLIEILINYFFFLCKPDCWDQMLHLQRRRQREFRLSKQSEHKKSALNIVYSKEHSGNCIARGCFEPLEFVCPDSCSFHATKGRNDALVYVYCCQETFATAQ